MRLASLTFSTYAIATWCGPPPDRCDDLARLQPPPLPIRGYQVWCFAPGFHRAKNLSQNGLNARDGYIQVARDFLGRKPAKEKLKDLLLAGLPHRQN